MTPTAVGLVLVEGHGADGDIMDQAAFDVPTRRGATAISTSEYVAGAMKRTRAMANGHRPHAIGVTWSDDSELEASLLLKSLTDAGFDNIVAVRSPEASEALARGIGRAVGYRQTAVCLLEPESIVVSMVDTYDGAVETVAHQDHVTDPGLIDWLSDVFSVNGWHPDCVILVGPDAGLTALAQQLEQSLGLPVFAPPEAELALARGAALASAHTPELGFGTYGVLGGVLGADRNGRRRSLRRPYIAALTMLIVGILAFVVSVSLVAGLQLTANAGSRPPTAQQSAATPQAPPVVAQVAVPPAAPRPVQTPPPPQAAPAQPSSPPVVEAPLNPINQVSADQPAQLPAGVAAQPPDAAPPPDAASPPDAAPPPDPGQPAQSAKPPLLTRILSHIPGLHAPDPQPMPADPPPSTPAGPPDGPPPSP